MRKLNLMTIETTVYIEEVPRRCILRDVSFSGSKIIMVGVAKFLLEKNVSLRIDFNDPRETLIIKGKFIRAENVEGKKDMTALGIIFDEAAIPMSYKIRLNDMLSSARADYRGAFDEGANNTPKNAAPPKP